MTHNKVDNRLKLSNATVSAKCLPPAPGEATKSGRPVTQKIYWDSDDRGFGVLVGKGAKTFIAQKDIAGRTVRCSIGRFPTWTVDQARKRAKELLVLMDQGIDPNRQKQEREVQQQEREQAAQHREEWQTFTLVQAVRAHRERMRNKQGSKRSIKDLRLIVKRYCEDWLRQPVCELRRKDCNDRHAHISAKHGPYAANGLMRAIRACYNTTGKLYEDLPGRNPVEGVEFNRESRRQEPIPWAQLPAWRASVMAMENRVRRTLQIVTLFTGLRRTDAATIRWEEIDFAAGTVHRPNPKGGERKAFTIPLCAVLLRLLARHKRNVAKEFGAGCEWAFPTRNREGQLVPVQEPKEGNLPSPHRLRDTFTTAAYESGVDEIAVECLTNHRPAKGSVTRGYIGVSVDHMRLCTERTAKFLRGKLRAKHTKGTGKKSAA